MKCTIQVYRDKGRAFTIKANGEEKDLIEALETAKRGIKSLAFTKEYEASRGEKGAGKPSVLNPQEPKRRKGEITEFESGKPKDNREPLSNSSRNPESLKMDANIAFPIFEKALKKKEGKS